MNATQHSLMKQISDLNREARGYRKIARDVGGEFAVKCVAEARRYEAQAAALLKRLPTVIR